MEYGGPSDPSLQQSNSDAASPQGSISHRRSRRSMRPSTAPPAEQRGDMLPSVPSIKLKNEVTLPGTNGQQEEPPLENINKYGVEKEDELANMLDSKEDPLAAYVVRSVAHTFVAFMMSSIPGSEVVAINDQRVPPDNPPRSECILQSRSSYDWANFINTYASGRWDPLRTPNPPTSSIPETQLSRTHPIGTSPSPNAASPSEIPSSDSHSLARSSRLHRLSGAEGVGRCDHLDESSDTPGINQPKSVVPLKLPPWPRISLTDLRSTGSTSPYPSDSLQLGSNPEFAAAAATMRVAASRINLSPLTLPSPERELTDPMRDHTTAIPRSYPCETSVSSESLTTSGARKSRLTSFWQGTQDVDQGIRFTASEAVPNVLQSMSDTVSGKTCQPPLVSAPTRRAIDASSSDYLGNLEPISEEISKDTQLAFLRAASPFVETGALSTPTLPHLLVMTRQISSPLPSSTPCEPLLVGNRARSESFSNAKVSYSAKEEQSFVELDYLVPPNPPDEFERRRALHK
jgi:hypothetical protein